MQILEKFEGRVDRIDDGIAFVTFVDTSGDAMEWQCPADEVLACGIRVRGRFRCKVALTLEPIPGREIDESRIAEKIKFLGEMCDDDY